jgi:hypothetical protein
MAVPGNVVAEKRQLSVTVVDKRPVAVAEKRQVKGDLF